MMRKLLLLLIPLLAVSVDMRTVRHVFGRMRSHEFPEMHIHYLDADSVILVYIRGDSADFDTIRFNHLYGDYVSIDTLATDMFVNDVDITGIEKAEADTIVVTVYLLASGNVAFSEYIYHGGDINTFIRFQDDNISFNAGGMNAFYFQEGATSAIKFNGDLQDIDFVVYSAGPGAVELICCDAELKKVGIGTATPSSQLEVAEDIECDSLNTQHNVVDIGLVIGGGVSVNKWVTRNDSLFLIVGNDSFPIQKKP